jgi:branched-chain amino acid transport system ATP-binding protein
MRAVEVVYDQSIRALHGTSIEVARGSLVALLGANGAGKTTTLKAASALLHADNGEVVHGDVLFLGESVIGRSARQLVQAGLVQVLEGRHCFGQLTVEENLISGALVRRPSRRALKQDLERMYAMFPRLLRKRNIAAGYTSGGEQQMVAIARALMARPQLVLLDEPSMGLAPQVVAEVFEIIRKWNLELGVTFLLAEQNAAMALRYADYGYILENGRIASHGPASELRARDDIKHFYLGVGSEGRRSFRSGLRRVPDADKHAL